MATCEVAVTVVDDVPMTLTCEPTLVRDAPADSCGWSGTLAAEARDNCSFEALAVTVQGGWEVGTHTVTFDSPPTTGDAATCASELTVRDVTPPVVTCGLPDEVTFPLSARAASSDACGASVTVGALVCEEQTDAGFREVAMSRCQAAAVGDTVTVGSTTVGALRVRWTATAVDGSGNEGAATCEVDLESVEEGFSAEGSGGCSGGPLGAWAGMGIACLLLRRLRSRSHP